MPKTAGARVVIFAVSQKDADSTSALLHSAGLISCQARNGDELMRELSVGAGALLVAKEALNALLVNRLSQFLKEQPTWSILPVIMLAARGDLANAHKSVLDLFEPIRNLTLLERPVRTRTLISILKAAIADRSRQYTLRDTLLQLEISRIEAVEASQAKSSFLANMSHEIRTPLGSILGFSELLSDPKISEQERGSFIASIRRNGELLSSLVNDVLDLAKVEAGHLNIEKNDCAIMEILDDVISGLTSIALKKGIALKSSAPFHVPHVINTDSLRVKQILINLVGNALKFTERGGVKLCVEIEDQSIVFLVRDSGIGLTPQQISQLFKPFSQADSTVSRKFGGTGLGLVLSRKLAEALGGQLIIKESTVGQGSVFQLSIPLVVGQANTLDLRAHAPAGDLKGASILLADDSEDNQFLITRILKAVGATVTGVANGEQAITMARSQKFDLVLMDIQMPVMDGHEATSRLRAGGLSIPVVALTAHALKEDREKALRAGCDDYLSKPIDRHKLIETTRRLLGRS